MKEKKAKHLSHSKEMALDSPASGDFLHDLRVVMRPIAQLKPYKNNARKHTRKQVKQIAGSIEQFGYCNPVLLGKDDTIIAGHGRVEAAKLLGLNEIPTIQLEHLSEAEIRAYVITDNRLAELSGWDTEVLAIEFQELLKLDLEFDITVTGYDMGDIDFLIHHDNQDDDPADTIPNIEGKKTVSKPGDIWVMGDHRVMCADVRDKRSLDRLMKGRQAAMVFTDPPYNVRVDGHVGGLGKHRHAEFQMASGEMSSAEFTQFLKSCLQQLTRVCKPGSLSLIFMDWRHISELQTACQDIYSQFVNMCVWVKSNGGMGSMYRSQHELVLIYKYGKGSHINNVELGTHGRYRTNVWHYPGMNAFGKDRNSNLACHPTIKPTKLVADAILDVTNIGDIVLDGLLGAGTTVLAAERTGRVCYGVEIEPKYVDLTIRRWQVATGKIARHAFIRQTFNEREAAL